MFEFDGPCRKCINCLFNFDVPAFLCKFQTLFFAFSLGLATRERSAIVIELYWSHKCLKFPRIYGRIPTVKLKIPGKAFLKSESRTSVTFKLLFLTLANYQWQRLGLSKSPTMKKLWKTLFILILFCFIIITEIRDSDFKNAFPGIFNFTVGILIHGPIFGEFDTWTHT